MISFKSKISSPSRFALSTKKQTQHDPKLPSPRSPNPQDFELRHTEIWTRDHLDWFHVDFDPSRFHTIPIAFISMNSPARGIEELMQKVTSLVGEYKGMIQTKVEWNYTTPPEKGKDNWNEVSARPSRITQLFVGSLINLLLSHLSNGKPSLTTQRNEMLKIVYAGHGIFKDKYFGVYRQEGKPRLSVESDTKYMYGRTQSANEDIEYINAAHVFSDILAMSQEFYSQLPISSETAEHAQSAPEIFVVNVLLGQIRIFWCGLPQEYTFYISKSGRPPKPQRITLYHTRKYDIFTGLQGFITDFARVYRRLML